VGTNLASPRRYAVSSLGSTAILLAQLAVVFCAVAHAATAPTAQFNGAEIPVASGLSFPFGVAVDGSGNVYVADTVNNRVLKEAPGLAGYIQSVVASATLGGLSQPNGVAVDGSGNVYIADTLNNRVLKETLGSAGYSQSVVASATLGGLGLPHGVAVNETGNDVYISDGLNNRVLKETLGLSGLYAQSVVTSSILNTPFGLAVDGSGNVYIADNGNSRVLKETPSGSIYTETVVPATELVTPGGVAVDGSGNLYITDTGNSRSLKETLFQGTYTQSILLSSGVEHPYAVAVDGSGNLYIADTYNARVLQLQTPTVNFGSVNVGSTSPAIPLLFTFDTGGTLGGRLVLTQGLAGLDFAEAGTGSCSEGTAYAAGDTCTIDVIFRPRFAGTRYGAAVLQSGAGNPIATGYLYGTGLGPQTIFLPGTRALLDSGLANPYGLAADAGGNIFFADSGPDSLYNLGNVYEEKLSGGFYSRILIASGLMKPTGVAVDGSGIVYVAAGSALYLYKQTLFDGSYSQTVIETDLTDLTGIAVDRSGNLYLISSALGDVHKETLQADGSYTETAVGSGISDPTGVAVDGSGNIYITDARQGEVYREAPQANGSYIQIAHGIAGAQSVALGGDGNVYITVPTRGEVLMETLQTDGSYIQTIVGGGLNAPWGITVDGQGNLYYSHHTPKGALEMIDVADIPSLSFAGTELGSTSVDSPQSVTVLNIGNAALDFPVPAAGTNPSIASSFMLDSATTCPEVRSSAVAGTLHSGSSCVYAIDFVPVVPGSVSGSLVLTDTNQNAPAPGYFEQRIGLVGTGIASDATRTTLRVAPNRSR
jgi:sugar lactone lactonase YvrE